MNNLLHIEGKPRYTRRLDEVVQWYGIELLWQVHFYDNDSWILNFLSTYNHVHVLIHTHNLNLLSQMNYLSQLESCKMRLKLQNALVHYFFRFM